LFKSTSVLAGALALCLLAVGQSRAQQHDAPKVEVGGHFTTLEARFLDCFSGCRATSAGGGARVGYNVTDYFGLEGEVNFFPQRVALGRATQALFGVKAGKRWRKFGLFVKARPGFVSLSEVSTLVGETLITAFDGQQFFLPDFADRRRTLFAADVGGAVELYPSRKLLVRVDVGDTSIRYRGKETRQPSGFSARDLSDGVTHNFQLTTGVAYRFHDPASADEANPPAPHVGTPRYEAGFQYTTLVLNRPESITSGGVIILFDMSSEVTHDVGGRFTVNLNEHVALEGAVDFLTKAPFIGGSTYGTHGVQGQFGVKAGRRFKRVGLFGKARPGFLRFSNVVRQTGTRAETRFFPGETVLIALFRRGPKTYFEMDVGGVVEFHHGRRIFTRFDLGDTIIRYSGRVAATNSLRFSIFRPPDETKHNFQFSTGVGFRF
jgi:hypothetical protein